MRRKSTQPSFNDAEIELMRDVANQHVDLAAKFGCSVSMVAKYRMQVLGIYMRGQNYDLERLRDSVDWSRPSIYIARRLKVSPATVDKWRRQIHKQTRVRMRKLTDADRLDIEKSDVPAAALAEKFGVSRWMINHVRRQAGVSKRRGRPKASVDDYPADYDWSKPTLRIANELGISWPTADKLRAEALRRAGYAPTAHIRQPCLPGLERDSVMPPEFRGIDWKANTSLLMAHLGLDKDEVKRLKSLARRDSRQ